MNTMRPRSKTSLRILFAALIGTTCATSASAEDMEITAEFRPSMLNPTHNDFVNTTPMSGYCFQHGTLCRPGEFTVQTSILATNRRLYGGPDADDREKYFLAADGQWKDLIVHSDSGQSLPVRLRLFLIGMEWNTGNDGASPGSTGAEAGGCRGRTGVGANNFYRYAWSVADAPVFCYRRARPTTDKNGRQLKFSIGYLLETPSPSSAQSGTYEGTLTYTVGNGQQIDLGQADYTDDVLNLKLKLTVAHDFQVVFAGNVGAHLLPDGGWQPWADYGKVPARLQQRVPFQLTSSGEFSLKMRCEHESGTQCGIRNSVTQTIVPLEVSATLPSMHRVGEAVPANHVPLVTEHSGRTAPRFAARYYSPSRHSALEFAVVGEPVKQMLDEGAATWQGEVTVIFDASP